MLMLLGRSRLRFISTKLYEDLSRNFSSLRPDLNFEYLLDDANKERIQTNIRQRKGIGNIDAVNEKWKAVEKVVLDGRATNISEDQYQKMWNELYEEALLIPNESHPASPVGDESASEQVDIWGERRENTRLAEKLGHQWRSLLYPNEACGQRSYAFLGALSRLEKALLDHAYDSAISEGFVPVVVGDFVSRTVTQACGVQQRPGAHPIQYVLDKEPALALSGTAEMGVASLLRGRTFKASDLPARLVSLSRCFRPEISKSASEAKLYRVHEFTKVELFVVSTPEQSEQELENIVRIQSDIFRQLGIQCRVLNMATEELGAPANRKFDIEAWMPGRGLWGEVSSASNCTDYQARRLDIRCIDSKGNVTHAHTCNGTAVAATRALIAVLETHQNKNGGISLPDCLRKRLPSTAPQRGLRFQRASPLVS